jgi:hypothetical protein
VGGFNEAPLFSRPTARTRELESHIRKLSPATFEEWQTMWDTLAGVLLDSILADSVGYVSLGGGIEREVRNRYS